MMELADQWNRKNLGKEGEEKAGNLKGFASYECFYYSWQISNHCFQGILGISSQQEKNKDFVEGFQVGMFGFICNLAE